MSRRRKQVIPAGTIVTITRDISPGGRLVRAGTNVTLVERDGTDNSCKVLFDEREFWLHKDDIVVRKELV